MNAYTGTSYQDIPALKKAMSDQMMDDLTAMDELLTENPTLAKKTVLLLLRPHRSQPDSGGPEETVRKGFPGHRGLHMQH